MTKYHLAGFLGGGLNLGWSLESGDLLARDVMIFFYSDAVWLEISRFFQPSDPPA